MIAALIALLAAQPAPPVRTPPAASVRAPEITVAIPPPAPSLPLPNVDGPAGRNLPLVVIDAGHGGHDPGAINGDHGWREKDVTLRIARALRTALLANGRIRVAMTRSDDNYLSLQERYGVARRLGADLFISIHADSATNPDARGATIYTLSEVASDREAARLAARENRSDLLNGVDLSAASSPVSSILIDLARRDTLEESARFAAILEREAGARFTFQRPARRFASLVVLKAPDVPSVLLEVGFMSNSDDARMLVSKAGQQRIAQGVARAVTVHLARERAVR